MTNDDISPPPPALSDRLTAWWLDLAPSRQEELLAGETPVWFAESVEQAELDRADVERYLRDKRDALDPTRDAGLNPRPDGV